MECAICALADFELALPHAWLDYDTLTITYDAASCADLDRADAWNVRANANYFPWKGTPREAQYAIRDAIALTMGCIAMYRLQPDSGWSEVRKKAWIEFKVIVYAASLVCLSSARFVPDGPSELSALSLISSSLSVRFSDSASRLFEANTRTLEKHSVLVSKDEGLAFRKSMINRETSVSCKLKEKKSGVTCSEEIYKLTR